MHRESFDEMARLVSLYGGQKILEVGSSGESYRELFKGRAYTGIDIQAGENVDLVVDPYEWPFPENEFDLVISGQTFEHIEFFWLSIKEMARVLKSGGYILLIAPGGSGQYYEHRHPVDCWRFMPDGFRALAKWANLEAVEIKTLTGAWKDISGVFRKN